MQIDKNVEEDGVIFMSIREGTSGGRQENSDSDDVTILAIESSCDETAAAGTLSGMRP